VRLSSFALQLAVNLWPSTLLTTITAKWQRPALENRNQSRR